MRVLGAVLLAVVIGGCTSVRMVQRDGCWVRQTKKLGQVREEMGPCARAQPAWVEDRLTRMVQECVARSDYRWHSRALAAWSRGERVPAQEPGEKVLQDCVDEAARGVASENESLAKRLGEVSAERATLAARAEEERARLASSNERIAGFLGEAAKRPDPPATATAFAKSEGRGDAETRSDSDAGAVPALAAPAAPRRARASVRAREAPPARPASAPACPPVEAGASAPRTAQAPPGSEAVDVANAVAPQER
jgi:hypothetical protein